ncbi:MAG: aspartyl protease family protein [Acidobacteriaceae bacterium]|nr:aspartyl protease family protein [Acidobacteriaceae bacterium]
MSRFSILVLYLCPVVLLAGSDDGMAAYREANYAAAIPLLQAASAKTPQDPLESAALLSSLVYEDRLEDATAAAETDATTFPASPEVIAARGEFAFYMGDMLQAEHLFKAAIKLKDETPRAYYGLYRLYHAASLYKTARLLCLRAHEIDPGDALITLAFLRYAAAAKREELEKPFIDAHPWLFKHFEQMHENSSEVNHELNGRKIFELDGPQQETTLRLEFLRDSPTRIRGVGLDVSIEGHRPVRLLLDTGASGILITQSAVDKAGLNHLGSFDSWGIGDKGTRKSFVTIADFCEVGSLKYKTCAIRALEGKGRVAGDEDGLIGADFFAGYLIQIDFQKRLLHLTPQPKRPDNPQGYDRAIPPEEAGFTPVFRFGHGLFVQTIVNGRSSGLFLLDTGASISNIDSTFARLSTKIHGNDFMHVKGISGSVKDVFEADKAELQFAHFRQSNLGLVAFNLNNAPEHQEFRMSGILGIPVLSMFRLTIDYRNGLVNFDYVFK